MTTAALLASSAHTRSLETSKCCCGSKETHFDFVVDINLPTSEYLQMDIELDAFNPPEAR